MKKSLFLTKAVLITALSCIFLPACQKTPENEAVVHEQTVSASSIQQAVQEETTAQEKHTQLKDDADPVRIQETFTSTDGSVHFSIDATLKGVESDMPIIKVQPHYLTAEEAKRAANALLGNAKLYEREPYMTPLFSKEEIRQKMERWSAYAGEDALHTLYGSGDISFVQELVQEYLSDYTLKYESAPEENRHVPCKWTFQEESRYSFPPEQLDASLLGDDNSAIMADCEIDGIPYSFDVVTRDKPDYKLNMINVFINSANSPYAIEEAIVRANHCRTEKPEQVKLDEMQRKAESILQEMGLGEWSVNSCALQEQEIGDAVEYTIQVDAAPCFDGVSAVDCEAFFHLKGEDAYASNYYLSSAKFSFAPDGVLLSFSLASPIDVIETGANISVMESSGQMLARTKEMLSLTDCFAFFSEDPEDYSQVALNCEVNISSAYYGLIRRRVAEQEDLYQYVPAFVLVGDVEVSNADKTALYMIKQEPKILLALDAATGAVLIAPSS